MPASGPPVGLLAELTHRCPLQCPYCSNPADLLKADRELATDDWLKVFQQAADMGVLQVHLSGGEPTVRRDLEKFIEFLCQRGIYTNLITAGVGLSAARIEALVASGLDHVQVSFQGAQAETTELIGKYKGGHDKKLNTARSFRAAGLPLTINAPIHRHNINEVAGFIDLALDLGAERLEIANVQYYGWAYLNRAALMPDIEDVRRQVEVVESARDNLKGIMNIDFVVPDYYADYPKPCMGGWASDVLILAPDGSVLPCHAAQTIKSLEFDNVRDRDLADIWENSPALNKYRGFDWMEEPCRSCPRKQLDFGGCRCQAYALTGKAQATDPACMISPHHKAMEKSAVEFAGSQNFEFIYRKIGNHKPDT